MSEERFEQERRFSCDTLLSLLSHYVPNDNIKHCALWDFRLTDKPGRCAVFPWLTDMVALLLVKCKVLALINIANVLHIHSASCILRR